MRVFVCSMMSPRPPVEILFSTFRMLSSGALVAADIDLLRMFVLLCRRCVGGNRVFNNISRSLLHSRVVRRRRARVTHQSLLTCATGRGKPFALA